jgi:glycine cleavage system H protein
MSRIPEELLYSEEHLWVGWTDDAVTIGLTDYAQQELGDIVFVELPEVDESFGRLDVIGTIEAVKAVTELFSPVGGTVLAINPRLDREPALINSDPYGEGWLLRLHPRSLSERDELLGAAEYRKHTGE